MTLYLQPKSLEEAVHALADHNLFVLAGGTDYFPARVGKPLDEDILDITGITNLRGITDSDTHFHIGALTRWTDVIQEPLPEYFDDSNLRHVKLGACKSKMPALSLEIFATPHQLPTAFLLYYH